MSENLSGFYGSVMRSVLYVSILAGFCQINLIQPAYSNPSASQLETQEAAPGPLMDMRRTVLQRIKDAKQHGVGIAPYLAAYNNAEASVRGGEAEDKIRPRLESLLHSLDEQIKRAEVLKTQRPVPITKSAAQQQYASPAEAEAKAAAEKKKAMLEKLKEKLKDDNLEIPDDLREKLMGSEQGKQILEKLKKE